eukprot:1193253-Prorocentrum_minimum.AAC.2
MGESHPPHINSGPYEKDFRTYQDPIRTTQQSAGTSQMCKIGETVGDETLINNKPRVNTAQAVCYCEFACLTKAAYLRSIRKYQMVSPRQWSS